MRCFDRAALACALLLALAGCQAKHEDERPPPIRPVLYTTVALDTTELFGPFTGSVEPRYPSQLGFQIPGRMIARDVFVGDHVRNGQRLGAIDPTVPQFQLAQAQAEVANANAQLENAANGEARQRTLFAGGNVTQAQVDAAVAALETARARLSQARAGLQKVQDQIGYTELKADFEGVVAAWSAEIGQVVGAGQPVVTVARPDLRDAVIDIPDFLLGSLERDAAFTVGLQVTPSITATGRVREIAPQSDPSTRTRRVRVTLERPPDAFRLGTTVTVTLTRAVPPRTDLPATALFEQDGRTMVWVVDGAGTSVVRRAVQVTARHNGSVTIANGLSNGDRVVTAGVNTLKDGQAVKLAEARP
jgi:membrane fusion protein, multidrug efflux system